jgi:hypothetical protein
MSRFLVVRFLVWAGFVAFAWSAAWAQGAPETAAGAAGAQASEPDGRIDPPAPVPPATVTRDAEGRVTMRAARVAGLTLDGRLDEPVYLDVPAVTDFLQQEPLEGQLATEKTDVWVFFDEGNVYVAARMWDSHPERMVANEMRRDSNNIFQNDNFGVAFDTYHNQRTGFFFQTNPLGGLRDALVSDEGQPNYEWDTVWDVKTGRFEQGWTTEILIPFKSLRYEGNEAQIWGVNFRRVVRWKNETSLLTRIPASYGGRGITMFSLAATLVGIEPPAVSRNIEIKPYTIAESLTNLNANPPVSSDVDGDFGVDVKYGLTRSLIADFTYNTDFAQVEDDEQQVNLTRFSLFFPEKREFFLEGQGIFEFGGVGNGGGDAPVMFFSRRIGLDGGTTVPIDVGGRVTGRVGPYALGFINIETDEHEPTGRPSTNFTVARLRRDVLRRSNVGVIFTRRGPAIEGGGANALIGLDAKFAFFQDVEVSSYYAQSSTPGREGDDHSYRFDFRYNADRYGASFEHLAVGENFNPEVGFVRRDDFRQYSGSLRFSPRPRTNPVIRKLNYSGRLDYLMSGAGRLETREGVASFGIDFENSDRFEVEYGSNYELLEEPFEISDGIVLPIGGYDFGGLDVDYQLGPQRRVSGGLTFSRGTFYTGDRTEVGFNGRVEITPQLSIEPRLAFNWIDLVEGRFTTELVSARTTYTMSPRMFVGALVQYNSSNATLTSNIRFRWEYRPGSDIFVVFSEGRDTLAPDYPALQNRGVVLKLTRLFRF